MVEVGAGETRTVGSPDRVIMTRLDEVELERNLIGVEMMRADHTIYSTVTLELATLFVTLRVLAVLCLT